MEMEMENFNLFFFPTTESYIEFIWAEKFHLYLLIM